MSENTPAAVPVGTLSPGRGIWYRGRVFVLKKFIPMLHSEYDEGGNWIGDFVGSHNALLWDGNDKIDHRNSHISLPNITPDTMVRPVLTGPDQEADRG